MSSPTPPPAESLLAHREWVRAVALRLVRDAHAADDLAQEAWLRALRSPPDPNRDPRPWLGRVLRNLASNVRRGTARRTRREALRPAPTPPRGPDELVAEAEQHRRLVTHVLALDEPFRGTLLLRFYEGLTPAAIAERLGVSAGTVHSRLARALERLRARLDEEEAGNRRAWLAALAPLATGASPKGATATSILGVLVMTITKNKAAVFLVALALSVGGGGLWWSQDAKDGAHAGSAPAREDTPHAPRLEAPQALRAREARAPQPAAPRIAGFTASIEGRVVDDTGAPVPGAELIVLPFSSPGVDDDPERDARLAVVRADDVGRFEIPVPAIERPCLVAHAPGHMPARAELFPESAGALVEIRMGAPRMLTIRVEDAAGRWPAGCGARVRDTLREALDRAADPSRQAFDHEIEATGRDAPSEQVVAVGSRAPLLVELWPARGQAAVPALRRLVGAETEASFRIVPSARIDFSVLDATTGAPPPADTSISVWIGRREGGLTAWSVGGFASHYVFDARLGPGTYQVEVRAAGYEPWKDDLEIRIPGERAALRVPLRRQAADGTSGRLLLRTVPRGEVDRATLALARSGGVTEPPSGVDPCSVFLRRTDGDPAAWRATWNADWAPTNLRLREDGRLEVTPALYSLHDPSTPAGTYDVFVVERGTGRAGVLRGARVYGDQENEYDVQLAGGTLFRLTDLLDRDVELTALQVAAGPWRDLPMVAWAREGSAWFTRPAEMDFLLETPRREVVLGPFPAAEIDVVVRDAQGAERHFRVRGASTPR